ncbi:MAG: tyrosine-type recombinase/integrase [Deltaproteobacteria bacterium]|nr:tyrosine-type recombinase/integrase [Deltaproteobacteria bacterium]
MRTERGLTTATVINYVPFLRCFLTERFGEGPLSLRDLAPSDSSGFILRHAGSMTPGRAKLMVTALRSFFRFLLQRGEIQVDLAASVPTVADWRLSTVPKYLSAEEIERLLEAVDRSTSTGRRNYAILLLLARLGLRAGEVVTLDLDDIDWRAGEIVVRGKGLRHDRLPLVPDVGEALAAYLQMARPKSPTRRVFLRGKPPYRGLAGTSTVSSVVYRALGRAGLQPPNKGAHLLRHSLATGMLHRGASMAEIGELLRHRATDTTEIYAKVDLRGLRSLAQPWPVAGGGQ